MPEPQLSQIRNDTARFSGQLATPVDDDEPSSTTQSSEGNAQLALALVESVPPTAWTNEPVTVQEPGPAQKRFCLHLLFAMKLIWAWP